MINVGIIDDSYFFLLSIREFLQDFEDVNIVFSYNSIKEFEESARRKRGEDPHIILLDFHLQEISGLEGVSYVQKRFPHTKILMLTSSEDKNQVIDSIHKGVNGFMSKGSRMLEIYGAIKALVQEGAFLSPTAALAVINHINRDTRAILAGHLSKRELDIVMQVKEGLSYKQMAEQLNVSVFTINHHLKKIYQKLKISSKSQLITAIYKNDL